MNILNESDNLGANPLHTLTWDSHAPNILQQIEIKPNGIFISLNQFNHLEMPLGGAFESLSE